jgi:hypothetical protein
VIISAATIARSMGSGRFGTDRSANTLLPARQSSVAKRKSRVGDVLVSGILWALVAAIATFVATIGVVSLVGLL